MCPAPFQPIPEATQPHVDRLIGAQVGDLRVERHLAEGRYGTLYVCRNPAAGVDATLEVLRTGLSGNDQEVRAADSLGCPGIVAVSAFGTLPDGRRYRVMEPLDGESLEHALQRLGPLPPHEVAHVLALVAGVLESTHPWAVAHGCLEGSTVLRVGGAVKLIDFGLARQQATPAQDLKALGALGFRLRTGRDVEDAPPPPAESSVVDPLDRLLRDLWEGRVESARQARTELETLARVPEATLGAPRPAPPVRPRSRALGVVGAGVAAALVGGLAVAVWMGALGPGLPDVLGEDDEALAGDDAADEPGAEPGTEPPGEGGATRQPPRAQRAAARVPSARALQEEISRLETRLRREVRPGDDFEQGLFVLNKQKLRLTGSPSVEDRRDVARQLRNWKRSYLKR